MKVKFPILFKHSKNLDTFLKFMEEKGIDWVSGQKATDYKPTCPVWMFCEPADPFVANSKLSLSFFRPYNEKESSLDYILSLSLYYGGKKGVIDL